MDVVTTLLSPPIDVELYIELSPGYEAPGKCWIRSIGNQPPTIFYLDGDSISWSSHKQKQMALSSMKAAYYAYGEGCKEVIRIHQVIKELQKAQSMEQLMEQVTLHVDN